MSKLKVMLVSRDKENLADLAAALIKHDDVALSWAESGESALNKATGATIDLVIADEIIGDMTGLDFAARLVTVNPMINCAVISQLSPEKYHQESEGFGVLAQLPFHPGAEHANSLLQQLRDIKNLMAGVKA